MYFKKELSFFTLIMISITAVLSLNSVAYMATIGLQSIIFFILAAVMFFIPSGLISAELAGMMSSDNGGIYSWVSRAFGNKVGLIAIWMEWFNNVINFPATIAGMVATFAYLGFPSLARNQTAMFLLIFIMIWAITLFNFLPINRITLLNIIGAIFGMIIPGCLLILCAIYWLFHEKIQLDFTHIHSYVPAFSFATFALFVKVLSSYSGIQAIAFHAHNIKNPRQNVPKSMLVTIFIILLLTIVATVGLASIVPQSQLNAMNGLIQGISIVLHQLHLELLAKIITVCICVGMIAAASTWVLGPARAIQEVAKLHLLPQSLAKMNKVGMPITILMVQGLVASIIATLFLLLPTIQFAFAMIIALTSQFTVVMFILVFASAIKLRFKEPNAPRTYRIGQSGNFWLIFWATLGIIACGCGFFLGLFPPTFSHVQNIFNYILIIIIADAIIIAIPFSYLILKDSKKSKN